jgi:PBP1b-binding outer membrane lipoprotein LpoB
MYKNTLLILGLLLLSSCSQNKPEPKIEAVVKTPIKTAERIPVKTEAVIAEPTEFIPEHIKRSSIEVVKHY